MLLIAAAVVALVWANSPWAASYTALWETRLTIGTDGVAVSKTLLHWINDGLMAIFFLVVGLEIKREVLVGELASIRRATLPIGAAVGGAVVPALIFLAIAGSGEGARGWAVPMATDIAFALGVLALVGKRIPVGLRIFMAALAIVDDLLAVLIIGLFYTSELAVAPLGVAASDGPGGCASAPKDFLQPPRRLALSRSTTFSPRSASSRRAARRAACCSSLQPWSRSCGRTPRGQLRTPRSGRRG